MALFGGKSPQTFLSTQSSTLIDLDTLEARKLGPTDLEYTLAELAEGDADFEDPAPTT